MPIDLRPSSQAAISVRCLNPMNRMPLGTGTVVVDGRRVGFTIAGNDRVFRVRPGVHTVEIRSGMARSNEVDLTLAPGEHAGLAFKLGSGWQPHLSLVTYIGCYLALMPIIVGLAYAAGRSWSELVPVVLNRTTFSQAMLSWVEYVTPALSSWPMPAVLFTLAWLACLPLVLFHQGTSIGELLHQVLSGGEIRLTREDRPASISPIDLMVAEPGPTPEGHLSLQAAHKARATLRGVQRPASRDDLVG
jgi:hypothetical protein